MLDAPVSGGVPAAADGTLTFIVGGTEEGMERARPLFMSMGSKAVHCGGAGTGCTAKASLRVRCYGSTHSSVDVILLMSVFCTDETYCSTFPRLYTALQLVVG